MQKILLTGSLRHFRNCDLKSNAGLHFRDFASRNGARRGFAGVAELVDALDLGSSDESRGGSSPSARTRLSVDKETTIDNEDVNYGAG